MFRSPWELETLNHEHIEDLLGETHPQMGAPSSVASRALTAARHRLGRAFIALGERLAERDAARTRTNGARPVALGTRW